MNANELADELETNINSGLRFTAATMLRQQQAEIEELETDNNQLRKEAQEHALEYLSVCGQADEHYEKARQQALEIQALHQILGYEGFTVGQDYLDECVSELRKAQEK